MMKMKQQDKNLWFGMLAVLFAVVFLFSGFSNLRAEDEAAVAVENEIDAIRFSFSSWSPKLLRAIDAGPSILSRDEVFDVDIPFKNSSEETKNELVFLQELVKTSRDDETLARIMYENSGASAATIFKNEKLIDKKNYDTIVLLTMIDADHFYFILERKRHFERPRPSQLDESLDLVIFNPAHAAYPSGHASQTYMVALVLSDFDPENAEVYKQFAIDVAHRREIAGVHYPSDSVAGRKLAVDIYNRLRENPILEKKYQAAKKTYIRPDLSKVGDHPASKN